MLKKYNLLIIKVLYFFFLTLLKKISGKVFYSQKICVLLN